MQASLTPELNLSCNEAVDLEGDDDSASKQAPFWSRLGDVCGKTRYTGLHHAAP